MTRTRRYWFAGNLGETNPFPSGFVIAALLVGLAIFAAREDR